MSKIRRIVCYAVNGSGMGHITRLLSVARWLRRYVAVLEGRPPEIIFLTSSEATGVLLQAGIASFKLPSKTVVRQAGMDMLEYRRLARHFVWQMLGTFSPDLLIVDTFPAGSFDELLQILDGPFHRALILRRVKPEYAARPIYQAALRLFPTIVIPHTSTETPEAFGLPPNKPAIFSGEVLQFEPHELLTTQEVRQSLGVAPNRKLIYISAGGGGDPDSAQTLHSLINTLQQRPDLHLLVGAGPLYQGPRAGGEHLTWFTGTGVWRNFAACEAAFSAGGYNTFHELLLSRVPTAFYAQPKVADHQGQRIEEATSLAACLFLHDPHDPTEVLACLDKLLQPSSRETFVHNMSQRLPDNGAARCAQGLLSKVYPAAGLTWASSLLNAGIAHSFEQHGPAGTRAMARWLPTLVPQGKLHSLAAQPDFRALTQQLSTPALQELQALLQSNPEEQALLHFKQALETWLSLSTDWPGGIERLTSLLDIACKKHPLSQEQNRQWLPWITSILHNLYKCLHSSPPLRPSQIAQIYRVFPKIADADRNASMSMFTAFVSQGLAKGQDVPAMEQALRVLKFSHRRITLEVFAPLVSS